MSGNYRFLDHTADFGLEIYGPDEKALFEEAAKALFDLITDPERVAPKHQRTVEVKGADWADLMVNWLRELLYMWSGHSRLVCRADLDRLEETALRATVAWERYDADRHEIRNEIKAVTYHQIEVGPCKNGWRARVIFDI